MPVGMFVTVSTNPAAVLKCTSLSGLLSKIWGLDGFWNLACTINLYHIFYNCNLCQLACFIQTAQSPIVALKCKSLSGVLVSKIWG